jgi:hypothetical protein
LNRTFRKVLRVAINAMGDADSGQGGKKAAESPVQNQHATTLDEDYEAIAALTEDLDQQVSNFVGNMNKAVDSAPAYDSLTALWGEMSSGSQQETTPSAARVIPQADTSTVGNEDLVLGDEAEDPNDPLVFI